ncbi:MAG: peptide chain release factor 1 [Holosporaceae bacterium]|jgi:peptide chain release factor 1|nr:peptide chain release factor 1 [Holosporaceae bacterium]
MSFEEIINRIEERHNSLKMQMLDSAGDMENFIKLSKQFSELEEIVHGIEKLRKVQQEVSELEETLADPSTDDDFRELAAEEIENLKIKIPLLKKEIKIMMIPKEVGDEKNAITEVRAGTGGDEAGLFAANLFRMYQKYAEFRGWRFEILYYHESTIGSLKEAAANISGNGVFSYLKFESGVHRVQRVPVTESSGRVHTSTATVAVLPEAEEVDVKIDEIDLRIDVMRASGAGGQHVNKTESAVRITHIPTGIMVVQQDERSQHMNRLRAMKILRSRLYEMERQKLHEERAGNRRSQIGTGDRSERIRTYNYSQGRVSDHRIGLTLYKLPQIMEGEGLDEIINALMEFDREERIANFCSMEAAEVE